MTDLQSTTAPYVILYSRTLTPGTEIRMDYKKGSDR